MPFLKIMKGIRNPFLRLTKFEWGLWLSSLLAVVLSSILAPGFNIFVLLASAAGVTALIFIAKGMVFGNVILVAFAALYAVASFQESYYGEMITYLCMSLPAAVASIISWLRNPFPDADEVKVGKVGRVGVVLLLLVTAAVTAGFYFLLGALGTAELWVSTLSVATSFFASALTFLRSPYYALAYTANDVVLIVLWVIAAIGDSAYFAMVLCFVAFLANDVYGFISWRRMETRQAGGKK